jgi:dephospho-CoA kinase
VFLIGLTGGIASGKSAVAHRFVEHGMELIDADDVARDVVLPGTTAWQEIVAHFGHGVLDEDGFVDRPKLGHIVFADPAKRTLLNEITHPRVIREIADRLEVLAPLDVPIVVDVPLLVEAGVQRGYDAIVVVASQPETQLRRLVEQRAMAEEDARARIAAQASLEDKLLVATHVIWNEGTLQELAAEADAVAETLIAAAKAKADAQARDIPND